MMYNVRLITF
jgi:hypothetical protein